MNKCVLFTVEMSTFAHRKQKLCTQCLEDITILGRVIKGVAGEYCVEIQGKTVVCKGRKSVQFNEGNLLIGDYVDVSMQGETGMIEKLVPRRNFLVRPQVANIDKIVILISSVPQADFYLIDKMLVSAQMKGIKACLVVNKADLNVEELYNQAKFEFGGQVDKVLLISTLTGQNVCEVEKELEGCLTCLVGQSAVGKSSLINALTPLTKFETGDVSKNNRGRHTTRHLEIVQLKENSYIIDTPGFSFLDIDMDPKDLAMYYVDYANLSRDCRFTRCAHINEPDCNVIKQVENGRISKERYDRYKELYNELLIKWRKKYG